jgi:hypothetical protein
LLSCAIAGPKPLVARSLYNCQSLSFAAEFDRRRYQSYERSHRAAAEALQRLRAERGGHQLERSGHGEEKAGEAAKS